MNRDAYNNRLERLSLLGSYLEDHIEQASVFVAPPEVMSFLPGLASKAEVVFFRSVNYTPHPVDLTRLQLIFSPDASITIKRRMNVLRRYEVQYILITDRSLKDYYANYTDLFNIQKTNGFWILELQDSSS